MAYIEPEPYDPSKSYCPTPEDVKQSRRDLEKLMKDFDEFEKKSEEANFTIS
jgi:hypothetical protein